MSLFGGSGFLGLGGTGLGDTATNLVEGAQGVIQDITEFRLELPNKIIDFGERLGESTFDTSSQTAQKFQNEALEFKSRQAGTSIGGVFNQALQFITNNLVLVIGGLVAWLIFRK